MYKMHRLVRRFVVSDMERGSGLWNKVYCVALVTVHEVVHTELEKEGKSFAMLPDVIGSNHDEFVAHPLALVHHHVLPAHGAAIRHVLKVEDIHQYCGMAMKFIGKVVEEVQVWEQLVKILHHQEPANLKRSCDGSLSDVGNEGKTRIADVYCTIHWVLHSWKMESPMMQLLSSNRAWT